MRKRNTLAISLIILVLSVSAAQAENYFNSDYIDSAKIRLGAGIGFADANTSTSTLGKFNATLPTYMMNLGYALTPELELGLMYFNSAKSTVTNGVNTIHMKVPSSTKAYLRSRWFYSDKIGAYGLMAVGPVEHTLTNPVGTTTYSDRFIGLGLGTGISWHVDPHYIIDAGLFLPNLPLFNKNTGVNSFSPGIMVSLNYAFGDFDTPPIPETFEQLGSSRHVEETPEPSVQEPVSQPVTINEPVIKIIRKEQLLTTIAFRSGHVTLNTKSRRLIKKLAKKIMANRQPYSIEIRGYADAEPIGGFAGKRHTPMHHFHSQESLSAARAESVANTFIRAGVDEHIIHADGFGATHFIADNKSRAGRNKNRRVEIYLVTEESIEVDSDK